MVCPSFLLPQSHSLQGHLLNINFVTSQGKKLAMSRNEYKNITETKISSRHNLTFSPLYSFSSQNHLQTQRGQCAPGHQPHSGS